MFWYELLSLYVYHLRDPQRKGTVYEIPNLHGFTQGFRYSLNLSFLRFPEISYTMCPISIIKWTFCNKCSKIQWHSIEDSNFLAYPSISLVVFIYVALINWCTQTLDYAFYYIIMRKLCQKSFMVSYILWKCTVWKSIVFTMPCYTSSF